MREVRADAELVSDSFRAEYEGREGEKQKMASDDLMKQLMTPSVLPPIISEKSIDVEGLKEQAKAIMDSRDEEIKAMIDEALGPLKADIELLRTEVAQLRGLDINRPA